MHVLNGEQLLSPVIRHTRGTYQQLGAAVPKLAAETAHAVVSAAAAAP